MFCTNCGKQYDDHSRFCPYCGTPNAFLAQGSPDGAAEGKRAGAQYQEDGISRRVGESGKKRIGLIACLAAVIAVLAVAGVLRSNGGYKKVIGRNISLYASDKDRKLEDILRLNLPQSVEKPMIKAIGYLNIDNQDIEKALNDGLDSTRDTLKEEFGDGYKISYKITDVDKMSRSDLENIEEDYQEQKLDLDEYDDSYADILGISKDAYNKMVKQLEKMDDNLSHVKVSKGYTVSGEASIKGKKDEESDDFEIQVVKMDGDWVIYQASGEGYFLFDSFNTDILEQALYQAIW